MTAYELAQSIHDADRDNIETGYRMTIEEAADLLRDYRYGDEDGEYAEITAEELAEDFNEIQARYEAANEED